MIDILVYELISYGSLRMLVGMMFSTFAFHYGWIKSNMHASNPFSSTAVFAYLSTYLINLSTAKLTWIRTDKTHPLSLVLPPMLPF